MTQRDLNDWLAYISQLHPQAIDLGLARVKQVAQRLGVANVACPVITVAGTNGKGSCVKLLESIFFAAHYRVGSFTSPHLLQFNERIQINGHMIDDISLCDAFSMIESCRQNTTLTYFEFNFLAALLAFKQVSLDVIILEVGMGGRLDAVNIIDPDVAIISSIGLDHTDYLGSDRETIAAEKAGILRAHRAAVCGDPNPPTTLLNIAKELQLALYCQGRDFEFQDKATHWSFISKNQTFNLLPKPRFLLQNAATVMMALQLINQQLPVTVDAITQGFQQAFLPGRFQVIESPVITILDVAHNPDSAQVLANNLLQQPCEGKTFAVWSMLENKDLRNSVKPLRNIIDKWFYAPLNTPRAATQCQLENAFQVNEINHYERAINLIAAYQQALVEATQRDRIVVFGSFYVVSEVLTLLLK